MLTNRCSIMIFKVGSWILQRSHCTNRVSFAQVCLLYVHQRVRSHVFVHTTSRKANYVKGRPAKISFGIQMWPET